MGFTPVQFIQEVQQDLVLSCCAQASRRPRSLKAEVVQAAALLNQRRDIAYLDLNLQDYLVDVEVTDEEVETRYQEDQTSYVTESRVDVEWLELTLEGLKSTVEIDDSEENLKAIYEDDCKLWRTKHSAIRPIFSLPWIKIPMKRCAGKNSSAADRLAGREDFAVLTQQVPEDRLLDNGGSLGMMAKGSFDPVFEDALWALEKPGDVSAPVRSEFGYHLIRLNEISAVEVLPLQMKKTGF